MAYYRMEVKIVGRSSGRSAVAAAAYRSGTKLVNEQDGVVHDYRNKDVVYEKLMLPNHFPKWNRQELWNEVERAEKSKDAQLAREFQPAFPNELPLEKCKEAVDDFARMLNEKGMATDTGIHWNEGNHHAHIMATMREMDEEGHWKAKQKKLYRLVKDGEEDIWADSAEWKIRKADGWSKATDKNKTKSVNLNDWNDNESIDKWRAHWEKIINKKLQEIGSEERVDRRSYKEQGIDKIPGVHLGPSATAIERKNPGTSYKAAWNRQILNRNAAINLLEKINTDVSKQMKNAILTYDQSLVALTFNTKEKWKAAVSEIQEQGIDEISFAQNKSIYVLVKDKEKANEIVQSILNNKTLPQEPQELHTEPRRAELEDKVVAAEKERRMQELAEKIAARYVDWYIRTHKYIDEDGEYKDFGTRMSEFVVEVLTGESIKVPEEQMKEYEELALKKAEKMVYGRKGKTKEQDKER